jgi:energy-coupling factor transporter ATP-binding protein EcfA2
MLQGPNRDFALHTIGWQTFQDLATTIAEVEFGRPVTRVAKVKDHGRDGSFYGVPDEPLAAGEKRETTIQSKHCASPSAKLTAASLAPELVSVSALVASGRAHGYVLVTNASLTEANRLEIVSALRGAGIERPYVFGREWVCDKILAHPKVRALAPRVYGLGDLSWIASDTARKQALAILDTMAEGLRCYVPTAAHRQAVAALARHHFVLLLGDPAVGKSSIAAALSVAATDEQNCDVIFVRNPGEFLRNWDPEVENRLFWIDDAFGATKLEQALMEPWNKAFSAMQAAMRRGNRFILTSRSHIWKQAQPELKQGAFPPLQHGYVVVDVAQLSPGEQQRILYNHLRFGAQPPAFKRRIRGHLDAVLGAGHFRPEIARRLADPAYTTALEPTLDGIKDFFARPEAFLRDTLVNLPDAMRAAIGLIFINGGRLASPIAADDALRLIEELYGVTAAEMRTALQTMAGSFVLCVQDSDHRFWTYKHPTIGDAYGRLVGQDEELVTLYVRGAKLSQLLDEAICGTPAKAGGIVIPAALYPLVLDRIPKAAVTQDGVRHFLLHRCGAKFLRAFLDRHPETVTVRKVAYRPLARDPLAQLVAKAAKHNCLPDGARQKLVDEMYGHAQDWADISFLAGAPAFDGFLTEAERQDMLGHVRAGLDHRFDMVIDGESDGYDRSWEPGDWFDDLESLVEDHRIVFAGDLQVEASVDRALKRIEREIESLEEKRDPQPDDWDKERSPVGGSVLRASGRSIFDDLI